MSASRYLVIGGAGLVGSHIRRALSGREVALTYHQTAVAGGTPLDITDAAAVQHGVRATHPDVVILAAAEPYVERCEREPEATRRVNVEGTRNVASAAAEVGATLVVFSSEYVFDGKRGDYGEDDATRPLNEYGRHKVELEAIARGSSDHVICRTSGVFGDEPARKNFVLQLVDALRAGRPFTVPSDQVITPTDVSSLAAAVVELIEGGHSGTFHICGPERMLRPAFAQRVVDAFGLDPAALRTVPTSELGLAAPRPLRAGLRDDKLRSVLGHGLRRVEEALSELARHTQ